MSWIYRQICLIQVEFVDVQDQLVTLSWKMASSFHLTLNKALYLMITVELICILYFVLNDIFCLKPFLAPAA